MVLKCDEVDPLLTPYLDGEAPPDVREGVSSHLGRCRPCAARAAREDAARRLVQLRARTLTPPAPPALRSRCAGLARPSVPPAGAWFTFKGLRLAVATAAVVLLAGVTGYGAVTHSVTLLVAGLTLDHLKCFALSGTPPQQQVDPHDVEARLARDYGWSMVIPGGAPRERLTLVGARRCLSSDGRAAHVLYRHAGKALSLFVMPDTAREAASASFAGYPARIWSRGRTTFVLLASESDAAMRPVAEYFQAAAY